MNKRQSHNYSLGAGVGYTWQHDFPYGFPNTPNGPFDYDFSTTSASRPTGSTTRRAGSAQRASIASRPARTTRAACRSRLPPRARARSARPRRRQLRDRQPVRGIFATPYNAFRQDNISVIDLRVEKTVTLGTVAKVRLFLDGFNLATRTRRRRSPRGRRELPAADRDPRSRARRASASVSSGSSLRSLTAVS